MLSLPSNFRPTYLYADKPLDISNWTALHIRWEDGLVIETKDGELRHPELEYLINFINQYSVVFTYSPPGKIDLLLSPCNSEQLMALSMFNEIDIGFQKIKKFRETLIFNGTPIFNLLPFSSVYRRDSLASIDKLAREIIESRGETLGLYSLSSGASEARAWMLADDAILDEIILSKKLKLESLDKFDSACFGGRMESAGIGTQYQFHYDLIKAHLNILRNYPGLRGTTWTRGYHAFKTFDNSLPHSIYKIQAKIPENKYKFYPLPVKTASGIKYPSGTIVGWYFKDYVYLLEELGIPFKVIDSLQFFGQPEYPFRKYMDFLKGYMAYMNNRYPGLETKHLYATLAGSTKAIFRSLTKELAEVQQASKCFDPLVYGFVLSRQNVELYLDAIKTDAEAIKIDALGTPVKQRLGKNYKLKGQGLTTYITPALKSMPSGEKGIYKRAIELCSDKPVCVIQYHDWRGLNSFTSDSIDLVHLDNAAVGLGQKYKRYMTIKPTYGNRKGPEIKRVGILLNSWMTSSPSNRLAERDKDTMAMEAVLKFSEGYENSQSNP